MIWVMAGLLTVLVTAVMAMPLVGKADARSSREASLRVYREQLAELDRDVERGLIGEAEAKAARVEVERRLLKLAQAPEGAGGSFTRLGRFAATAGVVAAPLIGLGVYAWIGNPSQPDLPLATRQFDEQPPAALANLPEGAPDPREMVASLEERLATDPEDAQGWLMLARSYGVLGDENNALEALRAGTAANPEDPRLIGSLAEALVQEAQGLVTPEARGLFERAAELDRTDPRPSYYLAQHDLQSGRSARAMERLSGLIERTPDDAPWRAQLEASLKVAAEAAGFDPDDVLARTRERAPEAVAAEIAELPPEERDRRIGEMVDNLEQRLELEGGGATEWGRLAQAQAVIGRREAALESFAKARAMAPDDLDLLRAEAVALLEPPNEVQDAPVVTGAARQRFAALHQAAPEDPQPLWYLGLHAYQQGQPDRAREFWGRLLNLLPEDHPDRAEVDRRMSTLPPAPAG